MSIQQLSSICEWFAYNTLRKSPAFSERKKMKLVQNCHQKQCSMVSTNSHFSWRVASSTAALASLRSCLLTAKSSMTPCVSDAISCACSSCCLLTRFTDNSISSSLFLVSTYSTSMIFSSDYGLPQIVLLKAQVCNYSPVMWEKQPDQKQI